MAVSFASQRFALNGSDDANAIDSPPPIVSHQGDVVLVHATNGLDGKVGTALHTHGQFFNGSTWFDGAVQTTQCPIPPGESLTYEIDTSLQTGTYW